MQNGGYHPDLQPTRSGSSDSRNGTRLEDVHDRDTVRPDTSPCVSFQRWPNRLAGITGRACAAPAGNTVRRVANVRAQACRGTRVWRDSSPATDDGGKLRTLWNNRLNAIGWKAPPTRATRSGRIVAQDIPTSEAGTRADPHPRTR